MTCCIQIEIASGEVVPLFTETTPLRPQQSLFSLKGIGWYNSDEQSHRTRYAG